MARIKSFARSWQNIALWQSRLISHSYHNIITPRVFCLSISLPLSFSPSLSPSLSLSLSLSPSLSLFHSFFYKDSTTRLHLVYKKRLGNIGPYGVYYVHHTCELIYPCARGIVLLHIASVIERTVYTNIVVLALCTFCLGNVAYLTLWIWERSARPSVCILPFRTNHLKLADLFTNSYFHVVSAP